MALHQGMRAVRGAKHLAEYVLKAAFGNQLAGGYWCWCCDDSKAVHTKSHSNGRIDQLQHVCSHHTLPADRQKPYDQVVNGKSCFRAIFKCLHILPGYLCSTRHQRESDPTRPNTDPTLPDPAYSEEQTAPWLEYQEYRSHTFRCMSQIRSHLQVP